MMKYIICIICCFVILMSCHIKTSKNKENKLIIYLQDSLMTEKAQSEIYKYAKEAIPYLINNMDKNQQTSLTQFINPIESNIPKFIMNNQIGIRYAYLIELILSKDSIETVNKTWNKEEDWLHWAEQTKPYRIYNIGIIVKQDKYHKTILEPLTPKDMVVIKKMYLNWWKKNKQNSIEKLRDDYRSGKKIIKFPYTWI